MDENVEKVWEMVMNDRRVTVRVVVDDDVAYVEEQIKLFPKKAKLSVTLWTYLVDDNILLIETEGWRKMLYFSFAVYNLCKILYFYHKGRLKFELSHNWLIEFEDLKQIFINSFLN